MPVSDTQLCLYLYLPVDFLYCHGNVKYGHLLLKGPPVDTERYNPSYTFTILPTTLCWILDLPIQAFYIHGIAAALLSSMTPAAANSQEKFTLAVHGRRF